MKPEARRPKSGPTAWRVLSSPAVAVALAAVLSGGCSGLLLGPPEPPLTTYVLAPGTQAPEIAPQIGPRARVGRGRPSLSVSPPAAAPGYRTHRMAYLERDYRLDYFAHNTWVAAPAEMLAPLLSDALRATGRLAAVTEEARGLSSDLRLDTFVIHLHQDFRVSPSLASVSLQVQLVDERSRRVLASRAFADQEPAVTDDPYGGVVAINRVLGRLLGEIAAFVVDAVASAPDAAASAPAKRGPAEGR